MPLLRGRGLTDARAALADLSARFLRVQPSQVPYAPLASGLSGIALAQTALDRVFPGAGHHARAARALEGSLERISGEATAVSFYSGFAGVGWVVARLVAPGDDGEDDPCAAFDEALEERLAPSLWGASYDLIDGLVGVGVYALERLPRPSGQRLVARVVGHLAKSARRRSPGVTWWTDPAWRGESVSARQRPHPDWNLGVAHGVPGVVAFLGLVVAADVDVRTKTKARALLERAVPWLLAQELPTNAVGCFAFAAGKRLPRTPTRHAWCYGDPGIAAALLVAARAAGEPAWEREAVRIGLRAIARPDAGSEVVDAGLCHGAAGLAHVFHRLYRTTEDERFADAARRWFARALAMRTPGRGFAGFLARNQVAGGKMAWRADPGVLKGAAGITLALIGATTSAEPAWDRILLLS